MAKVQGKKSAAGKKVPAGKSAAGAKSAKPAPKRPAKAVKAAAKTKAPVKKSVKKVTKKAASKPAPKPKVTAKGASPSKATKPTKPVKTPPAPAPKQAKVKTPSKTIAKVAASTAAAATPPAPRPAASAASEPEKKRRRSRPKVSSGGPATAAWFTQGENKPRPSSFIPAPPRAEAPSLVAAPPASSDRLVSNEELTKFVVRTAPVRIDVEASGGRIFLHIFPESVPLRVGEGIEWDFRYVGGADVMIEEMIVEFDKPSPFPQTVFRSHRPGINRPHRQLSGPVQKAAAGKTATYIVRALNAFKTEMATAQPMVTVG